MNNIATAAKNDTGLLLPPTLKQEHIDLIKRTIACDLTNDELALFIYQCRRTGLDPLARQIYVQKRYNKQQEKYVLTIQATIDGFRLIAERSHKYCGQAGPFWCGEDGQWTDVWLKPVAPYAAKIGIKRSDFAEPLWAVAKYSSYVPKYQKNGEWFVYPMWQKMADHMIAKVTEALALRRAFPNELAGIYSAEEMCSVQEEQNDSTSTQVPAATLPAIAPSASSVKRPFAPADLRVYMLSIANDETPASSHLISQTILAFSRVVPSDINRKRAVSYIFDKEATYELNKGECNALLRWCNVKEVEGSLIASPNACQEAQMLINALEE